MTVFLNKKEFFSWANSSGKSFVIISDHIVASLYGEEFLHNLPSAEMLVFSAGEDSKTRETKAVLEDELLKRKKGKNVVLIGLGGGVTTDLTGFLAATYLRGVELILIPTSLLAMVDACIGGKNGVNTSSLKNAIGTIYFPKFIVLDLAFLKTLPEEQWQEGVVEALKHGLIADKELFEFLKNSPKSLSDITILKKVQDIKEYFIQKEAEIPGMRDVLNFGHTAAHAIEIASSFHISHGKAVALGIQLESLISYYKGILSEKDLINIQKTFEGYRIHSNLDFNDLVSLMKQDKKSRKQAAFILLKRIGEVYTHETVCHLIEDSLIFKALMEMRSLKLI